MSLNVTKLLAMIPINEAKQRLQDLIDAVSQSHQPIVITSQSSNAIFLSEADWLAIQETLYLLSIQGMRESIRAGLATPIEECSQELEWWRKQLVYTKQAQKDAKKLAQSNLRDKAQALLNIIEINPFQNSPP